MLLVLYKVGHTRILDRSSCLLATISNNNWWTAHQCSVNDVIYQTGLLTSSTWLLLFTYRITYCTSLRYFFLTICNIYLFIMYLVHNIYFLLHKRQRCRSWRIRKIMILPEVDLFTFIWDMWDLYICEHNFLFEKHPTSFFGII